MGANGQAGAMLPRRERVGRVVAWRREGLSLRAIAQAEGVSLGQVQRDLGEATVSGDTVDPHGGKVRGRDGRVRPARGKKAAAKLRQPSGPAAVKAPFPYFGGKSRVASLVWDRLGDVANYVEPFAGSGAVLLARPSAPRVETVNDVNALVANFWRATSRDPEAVAYHVDGPVSEIDLHARHRHLVLSEDAAAFRRRMAEEADYFDARFAGWWAWGLSCWIGSGWCTPGRTGRLRVQLPMLSGDVGTSGRGVHAPGGGRSCAERRAWLTDWMSQLRDRLRTVRVCCGDWRRVYDSPSVTTGLGTTAVFLDPPYPTHDAAGKATRTGRLYAGEGTRDELDRLRDDVLAYCLRRGVDPIRLVRVGPVGRRVMVSRDLRRSVAAEIMRRGLATAPNRQGGARRDH